MTRKKIVAIAGILTLTATTIIASIAYFNYPKLNISHHEKSRDIITPLPQDNTLFIVEIQRLLNQARQYNIDKKPNQAIDSALDGIKKNHASNPIHDSQYYSMEAELYWELATSLRLKKDEARQKQAQEISNKAMDEQLYRENRKREEGLREVLLPQSYGWMKATMSRCAQ